MVRAGQDLDDEHLAATARAGRRPGSVRLCIRNVANGCGIDRGGRCIEQLADQRELGLAMAVGEEAVVADVNAG